MNFRITKWVGIVIFAITLNAHKGYAQAPDCDQCDIYIDDPVLYAECVQEYCNDAIPIDNNIWILLVGGVGMAAYAFFQYNPLAVRPLSAEGSRDE